ASCLSAHRALTRLQSLLILPSRTSKTPKRSGVWASGPASASSSRTVRRRRLRNPLTARVCPRERSPLFCRTVGPLHHLLTCLANLPLRPAHLKSFDVLSVVSRRML